MKRFCQVKSKFLSYPPTLKLSSLLSKNHPVLSVHPHSLTLHWCQSVKLVNVKALCLWEMMFVKGCKSQSAW